MGKATDKLRELLDERGVEHEDQSSYYTLLCDSPTLGGKTQILEDPLDGSLFITLFDLAPEQIVDVVLGRTAKAVMVSNGATGHCKCDGCGKFIDPWDKYCRHCGVRLEVER